MCLPDRLSRFPSTGILGGLLLCTTLVAGCAWQTETGPRQFEVVDASASTGDSRLAFNSRRGSARRAWLRAERYVTRETESDLLAAVRLYNAGRYENAKTHFDRIVLDFVKRTARKSPGGASASLVPRAYADAGRIRPGDALEISIQDWPELSRRAVVQRNGDITFHYIGSINIGGKTLPEVRRLLTASLGAYLKNPRVDVRSDRVAGRKAVVSGCVADPGAYPIHTNRRVLGLLAQAGGIVRDNTGIHGADLHGAFLSRKEVIQPVDFALLIERGDMSQNVPVESGDLIHVPKALTRPGRFAVVQGAVRRPGRVEYHADMRLLEAISAAGGLYPEGKNERPHEHADLNEAVVIRRNRVLPVDFTRLLVYGDASHNLVLNPDDFVCLPIKSNRCVSVLGEVRVPGEVFLGGVETWRDVLMAAGGLTDTGKRGVLYLVRGGPGHPKALRFELSEILGEGKATLPLQANDIVYVSRVMPRDVVSLVGRILPLWITVKRPWHLAGGIR